MTLKSLTTTKKTRRFETATHMAPVHPGEMLREEFLEPLGLSAHALAMAIQVPATRIAEIVKERRGISGDTAHRLGRYFHVSAEFWMNLQSHYELELARLELGEQWEKKVEPAPVDKDGVLLARTV